MRVNLSGLQPTIVSSLPAAAGYSGCLFQKSTDNSLWFSDGVNWFHLAQDDGNKLSTTAASGAINTTESYVSQVFSIAANQLKVGDHFKITAYGTCTSTAANLSTFTPRLGANGTTGDTALSTLTCTAATSGTAVPFCVELDIVVRAIGVSGTVFVTGRLLNNGATGISSAATVVAVGSAITINTTGALKLGLTYKTAAITTTSTFQSVCTEQTK